MLETHVKEDKIMRENLRTNNSKTPVTLESSDISYSQIDEELSWHKENSLK